ncbi:MAG TPA: NifB/NifX family molybdenum-iron cluster-binding protein [Kiritimatiellia bacterium]|mgnify:FL=1|nr:NifB/NifX family molybdenum-iron cluster-binding protein [Kiritimatiellia bacterium]
MKIAIPIVDGQLCMHFGHCAHFALVDVDEKNKQIAAQKLVEPPPHEPGVLPKWLHEQGATVILAGGMGSRAQQLFAQNGIQVAVGCQPAAPETLVAAYLGGKLVTGENACDH